MADHQGGYPPPPPSPSGPPPPPPPPGGPPPGETPKRRRRWPWITAAVLVVIIVIAGVAGGDDDEDGDAEPAAADETTTTTERTTTSEETTTTEAPTTTTTTVPEPVIYEGSGTQVLEIELPDPSQAYIATISHQGSRNFAVWELDEGLEQVDLRVNEIGAYEGTVLVNLTEGVTTTALEIEADGTWRVEIKDPSTAPAFGDRIEGTGDDVVIYTGDTQVMALAHQGDSNFVIRLYGEDGDTELLANEVGVYEATVPMRPGVLEITANGPWSIGPA